MLKGPNEEVKQIIGTKVEALLKDKPLSMPAALIDMAQVQLRDLLSNLLDLSMALAKDDPESKEALVIASATSSQLLFMVSASSHHLATQLLAVDNSELVDPTEPSAYLGAAMQFAFAMEQLESDMIDLFGQLYQATIANNPDAVCLNPDHDHSKDGELDVPDTLENETE